MLAIAVYDDDGHKSPSYYAGIIAEPPSVRNASRSEQLADVD